MPNKYCRRCHRRTAAPPLTRLLALINPIATCRCVRTAPPQLLTNDKQFFVRTGHGGRGWRRRPPPSRWRSAESSDSLRTSAPTFRRCDGGRGAANRDAVSDASARSSGPRWARRTRRPTGCPISFSRCRRGHDPHLLHLPLVHGLPRRRPSSPNASVPSVSARLTGGAAATACDSAPRPSHSFPFQQRLLCPCTANITFVGLCD
jgi:hypothetical protein